ncbi:MAG: zf-TFIIB domain-containing protein [Ignavibacteriae bacterium]|nr:zf-TFIIB domain-containing protein [Ignavibacteriota bacterium]
MPVKPSEKEEEYFARLEIERKKKLAEEKAQLQAAQQTEELKKLHWMHCPKCGMELQTITYHDIEVDRCFHCNGMWLDDGELEKLVAAESSQRGVLSSLLRLFK